MGALRCCAAACLLVASIGGCRSGGGCCAPWFAARAEVPADLTPPPAADEAAVASPETLEPEILDPKSPSEALPPAGASGRTGVRFRETAWQTERDQARPLHIPREMPGAEAPPLRLPPFDPTQSGEVRRRAILDLFPSLPSNSLAPGENPYESGEAIALADLQQIALENSPVVFQAAAAVEVARGRAIQAGLHPNPVVGYAADSIGTGLTGGYNGLFLSQEIVTAGKLSYARFAALMRMRAAEQDLRKARIALASDVRRGYFSVLVAEERLLYRRAMATLTDEVYRSQVDLVAIGEAAAYQPLQLRVFALEAQNQVVQAESQVNAAWRQLAAALGTPVLGRTPLVGSAEAPAPHVDYELAAGAILTRHTDLAAAGAMVAAAEQNLRLQRVTPVPNIQFSAAVQHDDTTPRNDVAANLQIGLPVPLFDRNQGAVVAAAGGVAEARANVATVRNDLMARLAEIDGRYQASRAIVANYRNELMQDQVRVYRGVLESYRQAGGDVDFAQLVVAQQSLAGALGDYVQALASQWTAAVDLAELLQADDFFAMGTPGL